MIAIFNNWAGCAMSVGFDLHHARQNLEAADCPAIAVFGAGIFDVTARYIGPLESVTAEGSLFGYDRETLMRRLTDARDMFPVISADGPARIRSR